eukprot:2020-Heterococcus_DN1.PRE.1
MSTENAPLLLDVLQCLYAATQRCSHTHSCRMPGTTALAQEAKSLQVTTFCSTCACLKVAGTQLCY